MGLDEVPLVEIVRVLKSKKVMGEASTVVSTIRDCKTVDRHHAF
jgi:hypothetical protein